MQDLRSAPGSWCPCCDHQAALVVSPRQRGDPFKGITSQGIQTLPLLQLVSHHINVALILKTQQFPGRVHNEHITDKLHNTMFQSDVSRLYTALFGREHFLYGWLQSRRTPLFTAQLFLKHDNTGVDDRAEASTVNSETIIVGAELRQNLRQLQRREAAIIQQRRNGTSQEPAATAELLSLWWVHALPLCHRRSEAFKCTCLKSRLLVTQASNTECGGVTCAGEKGYFLWLWFSAHSSELSLLGYEVT